MSSMCFLQGDRSIDGLFSTQAHTYVTFLESLGHKEINYYHSNHLDPNQDDQNGKECPPSVIFKKTRVLMEFLHTCYIVRILGEKVNQLLYCKSM